MRFSTSVVAALSVAGFVSALPQPQEPGSEKFECHSKCGGLISAGRRDDFADNCSTYRADYAYCLDCAGPDAQNIWFMYGNSVASAGTKCGWPTEPGVEFPAEEPAEETTTTTPPATTTTPAESTTTPVEETTTTAPVEQTTTAPVEETTTTAPVEQTTTTAPVEETTTAPVEETTTTAPATSTTTSVTAPIVTGGPIVNNGTSGTNSTNGGALPPVESDGSASTKFISTGIVAAGFAAVAFLL